MSDKSRRAKPMKARAHGKKASKRTIRPASFKTDSWYQSMAQSVGIRAPAQKAE